MTLISNFNNMILVMKKAAVILTSLTILLLTPTLVLAQGDRTESERPSVRSIFKREVNTQVRKVSERSCEVRLDGVKRRSGQLTERAQKMIENFAALAERVKSFYTGKLVPAGVTVSNYDALVSEINTKKAAVDSALAEAKNISDSFDCTDTATAKTKVGEYRTAMQKVIAALKEYKTSIKNLIVAVRTAAGSLKASPSPSSEE